MILSEESIPLKMVKLFLIGEMMAGKSTIKRALTLVS